jgi:3'(2'), 5'-bisphosphate nucleotidase
MTKDDFSPVTTADFAAQALLIASLEQQFPGDGFVGEEDAADLRSHDALRRTVFEHVRSMADVTSTTTTGTQGGATMMRLATPQTEDEMLALIDLGGRGQGGRHGRFWVMDPVDGTRTFLEQHQYAVSLSLIEDGREVVGVLCCPNLRLQDGRVVERSVDRDGLGVMLTAVRGQGATVRYLTASPELTPYALPEAQPLARLASPRNMSDLHIVDSRASTAVRHDVIEQLAEQCSARYPGTEVWSSHMRYASLILGGADCQIRVPREGKTNVCIWDHAGAQLIFTEIGGRITDLDGKDMDFGAGRRMDANRGMIVAREGVHAQLLRDVKAIIGEA